MMRLTQYILTMCVAVALGACSRAKVPAEYADVNRQPDIYPDYREVTVPVNMAPLHFELMTPCDEVVTRFSAGSEEIVCAGRKTRPAISDWQRLVATGKNAVISVEVFARNGSQWQRYKPFRIHVSEDAIDPWLSYRLISPSYVSFEELTINQRCLEDYTEQTIYNNMLNSTEADGQCINCHSYQRGNPEKMQFHARLKNGGTMILRDGQLTKMNLKTDSTLSAGVYPAWHPTLNLIAYSTNTTRQMFHTVDVDKVEVLDLASDLILFDVERQEVSTVESDPLEMEVFPSWSPDGQWLYYCSAHYEPRDSADTNGELIMRYKDLKYNVYRKAFDAKTLTFGPRELVFDAASQGKSATLPRVSPDGRWLLLAVGEWGVFHIWHRDADLWLMDLQTGDIQPAKAINSPDVESYHTWSTDGHWLVFSSRRYDGNYTRPFFAHFDGKGHFTRPFELPCDDPDYHRQLLRSYNIPELMTGRVTVTPQAFAAAFEQSPVQAAFVSR